MTSSKIAAAVSAVATAAALTASTALPAQAAAAPAALTVQAGQTRAVVGPDSLGVNTPPWNGGTTTPGAAAKITASGSQELVFNGGPMDDLYHWRTGKLDPLAAKYGDTGLVPQYSFDQWATLAKSTHQAMFVHVNYGTGTPAEAAAWVTYANQVKHYGIENWEIGEEVYLDGAIKGIPDIEPDGHPASQHTAAGFAHNAIAYIKAMRKADPSIRIGIPVFGTPLKNSPEYTWDATVLAKLAPYVDFVDEHWYPTFGAGTPAQVLATAGEIAPTLSALRGLIAADAHGRPVAIHIGETNSLVSGTTLTSSVTNALYFGETIPTLLENHAEAVDWWALYNGLEDGHGVGDLGLLSSGSSDCKAGVCSPPVNTPYPAYYGMRLTSALTEAGSKLVPVKTTASGVRAYAALRPDGSLAVLALNTGTKAATVQLKLDGYQAASKAAKLFYGRQSHGIATSTASTSGALTLHPTSLTELILQPCH